MNTADLQYSADIISASGSGRAYKRYRAVVDARYSPPRVVYWKDLTHLGWPLAPEILSGLRAAGTPAASASTGPVPSPSI